MVAQTGIFSPTTDDIFRVVLVVIGLLNIAAVFIAVLALRRYARLLLDVEQITREARNRLREREDYEPRALARDVALMSANVAELRGLYERVEAERLGGIRE
jgi:hypothetical protein